MKQELQDESQAIRKLIAEIDSLDALSNRLGWRIVYLFLGTFACAVSLLFYVAVYETPSHVVQKQPGPRVQPVLRSAPR